MGIDIEDISAMPRTNDFREAEFYKMNFASSEIAYCILQTDPYASFAGLFAVKEAIVKANNRYAKMNFNSIIVNHSMEGKPIHDSFQISISHAKDVAVAVAVEAKTETSGQTADLSKTVTENKKENSSLIFFFLIISLIISLAAIFIAIKSSK
jgi:phosphopantetheine--protein transferase-like protein